MAFDIDWSLLSRAKDPGQAFATGVAEGRATRDKLDQRNALSALTTDPNDRQALSVLTSLNPEVGLAFQSNALKQAEAARAASARHLGADYIRQQTGPSVLASPASAPVSSDPNEIVVPARSAAPPVSIADVYAADPGTADNLVKTIGSWDEQQRKQASAEADALAVAAFGARKAPYDQRRQVIDQYRPMLLRAGWSQKEIDDFDPTDEALEGSITHSLGVKDAMAVHERETAAEETRRHNRVSEGNASANLAVARSRLGLSKQREDRIAKWGPQPLFGTVPTGTDDLDY